MLFKLQELDLELLSKKKEIDAFEAELAERRGELAVLKTRLDGLSAERKGVVNDKALAEQKLRQLHEDLRTKRGRIQKVEREAELRAGEEEVRLCTRDIDSEETRLLETMEALEAVEKKIAVVQAEYDDVEAADHRHVSDAAERIDLLRVELEKDKAERDTVADGVDASTRSRYEMILGRRGGLAVVRTRGGVCSGCHMHIPAQLSLEIARTQALRLCPSCQRILFAPPKDEQIAEAAAATAPDVTPPGENSEDG